MRKVERRIEWKRRSSGEKEREREEGKSGGGKSESVLPLVVPHLSIRFLVGGKENRLK